MTVIRTSNMTKVYSSGNGVWDIDLQVNPGEIFGFLGSNGAGKTTTIRVLLGLLQPSSGQTEVLGANPLSKEGVKRRKEIGYLPGELALYENHTGVELLEFFAESRGNNASYRNQVMEVLSFPRVDLKRKIREYSRGMKQKLGLILALQHKPRVVFMDEPTTGLDPLIQLEVYQLLKDFAAEGGTVFMSSHNLGEVERVCNRVAIIRIGRLVALEEVSELVRRRIYSVEFFMDPPPGEKELAEMGLQDFSTREGIIRGKIWGEPDDFLRQLLKRGQVKDLNWTRGRLEDIFMEYYRGEEGEQ